KNKLFSNIKWHFVRSHVWLLGGIFMVLSLHALPLATANAIFYAAPLFVLPLGFLFYKDRLNFPTIAASILGFAGFLVSVQPKQINLGGVFARLVAVTMPLYNLLVRKLSQHHTVYQTLLLSNFLGIPFSLGLASWEGQPFDWHSLITAGSSNGFI